MSESPADRLYHLLPTVYRQKDRDTGELRALMTILESQLNALEGDMEALYDNWFIETCRTWVVPYIGDLLGVHGLSDAKSIIPSQRVRVANTIRYRRRKGITAILERVVRESTGWYARGVAYFNLMGMTQSVQHVRPHRGGTADLRDAPALAALGGPFERIAHTGDVRQIAKSPDGDHLIPAVPAFTRTGKFNLPNMGVFLWRLQPYTVTNPAAALSPPIVDASHNPVKPARNLEGAYTFHPFGVDTPLFNKPQRAALTQAAEAIYVPAPLSIEALAADLQTYYGPDRSLNMMLDGNPITPEQVVSLDLGAWDEDGKSIDWSQLSLADKDVAVDVTRGRLLFKAPPAPDATVSGTYTYGLSGDIGGGPYDRPLPSATVEADWTATVDASLSRDDAPNQCYATLQAAIAAWSTRKPSVGVIRILDCGVYDLQTDITLTLPTHSTLILEAPNYARAVLKGNLTVQGLATAEVAPERALMLSGLWIDGELVIHDDAHIVVTHTTLRPADKRDNIRWNGTGSGLNLEVEVSDSIVGRVCMPQNARALRATNCMLNAVCGPLTTLMNCTVWEHVRVREIAEAVNTIFASGATVERRQVGSVRFSYVPQESEMHTPRLFRCQPALALEGLTPGAEAWNAVLARVQPAFTSTVYGQPGYGQLSLLCPEEIRQGGEGNSEMGAFNPLNQPQRQRNLRAALNEYLGVDFKAGVFYAT